MLLLLPCLFTRSFPCPFGTGQLTHANCQPAQHRFLRVNNLILLQPQPIQTAKICLCAVLLSQDPIPVLTTPALARPQSNAQTPPLAGAFPPLHTQPQLPCQEPTQGGSL